VQKTAALYSLTMSVENAFRSATERFFLKYVQKTAALYSLTMSVENAFRSATERFF